MNRKRLALSMRVSSALALLCVAFAISGCGAKELSGGTTSVPNNDLQAAYDRLQVGDSIQSVEASLGTPAEVRRTSALTLSCTTVVYTDVLHGKSLVLFFARDRLLLKSFEDHALFPFLTNR
jgi:hypothetical protein